jgi:hypothetical protein
MESNHRWQNIFVSPGVKETASEDGAVLLDIEHGMCFSLNAVGLRVWEMLKLNSPLEQIAERLEQEFHAPKAELMSDVCDFVEQLESRHLISYGNLLSEPTAKPGWLTRLQRWKKA